MLEVLELLEEELCAVVGGADCGGEEEEELEVRTKVKELKGEEEED